MKDLLLVFDVESVGLHGAGFAVGAVIVSRATGERVKEFYAGCPSATATGQPDDREWISKNVDPTLPKATHEFPHLVREAFWSLWREWHDRADMWVDCGWPVEANFLSLCVREYPVERKWQGPYPLNEIATVLGDDALTAFPRLPDELPAHNPLNDARQSARILVDALNRKQP